MSQVKQERLSALIDDALGPDDMRLALEELTQDPNLRACWNRYHLIGDALRGEPLHPQVEQVAERVRERLGQEAEILPLPRRLRPRWLGPLAGAALAASLALLAIFAGPSLFRDLQGPGEQMADYRPNPGLYENQASIPYWGLRRPEVESKLNSFLVNHQEYAPPSGMKGMLPYATLVSHGSRR